MIAVDSYTYTTVQDSRDKRFGDIENAMDRDTMGMPREDVWCPQRGTTRNAALGAMTVCILRDCYIVRSIGNAVVTIKPCGSATLSFN